MSQVPAWKRIGLKVKEDVTEEPIASATHFDGSKLTNKIAKKLNKKRQLPEDSNGGVKKPPKRVKLPKSERGPPPEKDHYAYLKQFAHDKDNWKFSKQKQNWLLKNIENVPEKYETELIAYFEDIQGGARTRVEQDLRDVVERWNEYSKFLEEKLNAELYGEKNDKSEDDSDDSEAKKAEAAAKAKAPTHEYALRCQKLLSAMLEEPVHLEGETPIETQSESQNEAKAEETAPLSDEEHLKEEENEDNLIIEDVEVEEYDLKEPGRDETKESASSVVLGDVENQPKSEKENKLKKDKKEEENEKTKEKKAKKETKEKKEKKETKEKKEKKETKEKKEKKEKKKHA